MATNTINSLTLGGNTGIFALPYATCATAAATAAKVATVVDSGNFVLETGAMVVVKFTYENSVASPTLNVNNTGAKAIHRYAGTAASTGVNTSGWRAGSVQLFIYDGTQWVRDFWENSTYSNVSLGQGYTTCSTAAATAAKTASLSSYTLSAGGIVSVRFTNGNTVANPTLNVNSKGEKAIYFNGAALTDTGLIKAGDTVSMMYSTYYHIIAINGAAVTAGSYGPSANATPAHGGTFSVPYVTVDAAGRVTAASTKTITLPADTKVTQAAAITTDGAYPVILGYSTATTAVTNTVNKTDSLNYNPSTKELATGSVKIGGAAVMSYDDTNKCLNFTFN